MIENNEKYLFANERQTAGSWKLKINYKMINKRKKNYWKSLLSDMSSGRMSSVVW